MSLYGQLAHLHPRGITLDSRCIGRGDVFIACPGATGDGRRYVKEALARGAVAVLYESSDGFVPPETGRPVFAVAGLRAQVGALADEIYGKPSEKLWVAGVTGTNGKTTVSQWTARALETIGCTCGVIGTLGSGFPGALTAGVNTTPDAAALHGMLGQFVADGARAVAMEVSSIGLDQDRVSGVRFDVAAFTNLTRDHLDYHGSMSAYGEAKAQFFDLPGVNAAVINLDDDFGVEQIKRLARRMRVIGFGLTGRVVPGVQTLMGTNLRIGTNGLHFDLAWENSKRTLDVRLAGTFNASNLLAVVGILLLHGETLDEVLKVVKTLTPPVGRMQLLGGENEPLVVVDYAHTPDALSKALEAARESAASREGRLICVFGCGGDRDPGKRPLMGEIAALLADKVIVTSDNPRNENPQKIIDDILGGGPADAVIDRAEAIHFAIWQANTSDVVLIAGKGHEPYQEIGGEKKPFSDVEQAAIALARRVPA